MDKLRELVLAPSVRCGGIIAAGTSHHRAIKKLCRCAIGRGIDCNGLSCDDCGYITNLGRFVTAEQAIELMNKNGQAPLDENGDLPPLDISDDLYYNFSEWNPSRAQRLSTLMTRNYLTKRAQKSSASKAKDNPSKAA